MAEKILGREGGRVTGKLYSAVGLDADGTVILREWSDAEKAQRDAEDAAFAAEQANPKPVPKTLEERIAALEAARNVK